MAHLVPQAADCSGCNYIHVRHLWNDDGATKDMHEIYKNEIIRIWYTRQEVKIKSRTWACGSTFPGPHPPPSFLPFLTLVLHIRGSS